jgi:beta-glucosidase-like glycosyl hydrolase
MTPAPVSAEVLEKLMVGFRGRDLTGELRDLLAQGLGGVVLFPRNFSGPAELRALTGEIERAAGHPVLIGIDQEGGTRFSLPEPFAQWVSPEALGKLDDGELVETQARALARELHSVGCNLNFAPLLDLHMHPDSPVTRVRSLGADAEKVSRLDLGLSRAGLPKQESWPARNIFQAMETLPSTHTWTPAESAVLTFQAGSDMALLCHDWKLVKPSLEGLRLARSRGELEDAESQASHKRIERLQQRSKIADQTSRKNLET